MLWPCNGLLCAALLSEGDLGGAPIALILQDDSSSSLTISLSLILSFSHTGTQRKSSQSDMRDYWPLL